MVKFLLCPALIFHTNMKRNDSNMIRLKKYLYKHLEHVRLGLGGHMTLLLIFMAIFVLTDRSAWGSLVLAICIWIIISLTACTGVEAAAPLTLSIITRPAAPTECVNGGTVVRIQGKDIIVCNGDNGATGPTGNAGTPGADGHDGSPGSDGTNGHDGVDGHDGAPGTQINIVQFCSGATHYPSNFMEIGFCIDNNVYAVYSEHDGFLTLVPPGSYWSNAHGNQCSFTIQPNCVITH